MVTGRAHGWPQSQSSLAVPAFISHQPSGLQGLGMRLLLVAGNSRGSLESGESLGEEFALCRQDGVAPGRRLLGSPELQFHTLCRGTSDVPTWHALGLDSPITTPESLGLSSLLLLYPPPIAGLPEPLPACPGGRPVGVLCTDLGVDSGFDQ